MKFTVRYRVGTVLVLRVTSQREKALQLATEVGRHTDGVTLLRGTRPIFSQQFFNGITMKPHIVPSPTFAHNPRYVR